MAKKGQNKSSGVTDALKAVLPNDLKKNFTLTPKAEKGQKQKSGGEMVATYARSIEDHMLRHYEMAVATMIRGQVGTPLNIMDLIYYHTYGDYRMVYVPPKRLGDKGKIAFKYLSLDPSAIGAKPHAKSNPIERIVARGTPLAGIYGVYHQEDPQYRVTDVDWMNQELNKGSSGLRLMLPSVGTLTMMTYGYANINQELQKLLNVSLNKLNDVLREVKEDDNVLTYLVDAIKSDTRFAAVDDGSKTTTLDNLLQEAIDKEDDGASWESVIKNFTTELIESTTSRYIVGEEVKVSDKSSAFSSDEQLELEDTVGSGNYYAEEVFTITKVDDPTKKKKYVYQLEYEGAPISFQIKQSDLKPVGQPTRFIEKKKKSFVAIPSPMDIVFYSIIVDQMFALQAYLFTIKGANKINFGYLSPSFLPQKKSQLAARYYPEMYSPLLDKKPDNKNYLTSKPNEKQSFLAQLLQHRNYYTQMVFKTQRSLATDTRIFDEFYKDDLSLKEIKWLATALSDEAKVLVGKPDKSDPLAQLVYRTPGGDPSNVQFTGEADRRTVFYKVDIPMLKEVMLEYVRAFNEFTISAAFAIESSDAAPKEGQIARALWTSLKKRSSKLIEDNEAIPHEFFNNLFEEVRKVTSETALSFDLYPPNWSDTNILTLLTVDPSQLNILLTTEEYQKYLDEYIEYIYTRYGNRAKVASAITTSLESYRIKNASDYKRLRDDFLEMLTEHEKKRQLKATTQVFRAYSVVIAVMRGQLAIPLNYREDFIAEGYERDALRAQLAGRDYGERGIAAVPPEHPLHELLRKKAEARAAAKAPPAPATPPPVPLPFPSGYMRASPVIPEPVDIEEITESGY